MCRILSYLGVPIPLEELLYKPDNSFIKQSYHPKYMSHLLNLAGFGFVAWDETSYNAAMPYIYKTPELPFYDDNLRFLSNKIKPKCLLTHIRGVSYNDRSIVVSPQNVHPFIFSSSNIALAHNGSLYHFEKMKYDLLEFIKPEYIKFIRGTTDSEWMYAVFISQLPSLKEYNMDDVQNAIMETFRILYKVRQKHHITINSPVNLFITNGEFIAATRFVFDYGWFPKDDELSTHYTYHSLWYTYGESYGLYDNEYKMKGGAKKSSLIIASEPLTEDTTTWVSVPEYTMIIAHLEDQKINIISKDIHL